MVEVLCYRCAGPCAEVSGILDLVLAVSGGAIVEGPRLFEYRHGSGCVSGQVTDVDADDVRKLARRANRTAIREGLYPGAWEAGAWKDPGVRHQVVIEHRRGKQRVFLAGPDGERVRGERPVASAGAIVPEWVRRLERCVHVHGGLTRDEMGRAIEFYRRHRTGDWLPELPECPAQAAK